MALRDQLNSYSAASETLDAQTIVNSETEARKELHACQARLASLEKLLGPEGNVEIADLVQQLKEREERVKVLDAQMKSQDHVCFLASFRAWWGADESVLGYEYAVRRD